MKFSLFGIFCVLTIGVGVLLFFLNQRAPELSRPQPTNTVSSATDLALNQLRGELSGQELAVVTSTEIQILAPAQATTDADAYTLVGRIMPGGQVTAIAWAGKSVFWIEERSVTDANSGKATTVFGLVECRFDTTMCVPEDRFIFQTKMTQLLPDASNTVLELQDDARSVFLFHISSGKLQRVGQQAVGFTWLPNRLAFVLTTTTKDSEALESVYYELSTAAEIKSKTTLPESFSAFGVQSISDTEIIGLNWAPGKQTAVLLQLHLNTQTVSSLAELAIPATVSQKATTAPVFMNPQLLLSPKKTQAIILIPDHYQALFTFKNTSQKVLQAAEPVSHFLDDETYLLLDTGKLFSVGVQSGIQTQLTTDALLVAPRLTPSL